MVKRKPNRIFLIAAAGLFVAIAGLAIVLLTGKSADGGGQAWVQQNIEEYQATLAVSTNPTEQAFLRDKLFRMQNIEQNRLKALQNIQPKPSDACALRPTPEPTKFAEHIPGISLVENAPINPEEFTPANQWQGEWAGLWVTVYAGGQVTDLQQGLVWVVVENSADYGSYLTPARGGAVHITAADGLVLTLQSENGTKFYFDIASRSYLNAPGQVEPTLVPRPTFTPDTGSCPVPPQ